jgi:hypothetical protein
LNLGVKTITMNCCNCVFRQRKNKHQAGLG